MLNRLKRLFHSARTHQGFRRYFANTSWMFAEQILRMVTGLLVGIWVARYLGPSQFGLFSYVLAFAALFSSIAKLGLDSIIVRDLVREPSQRDVYLGTAFWLKIAGAVVTLGIIGIAMQLSSSDSTTRLYILIIASGAIFQSFEVVDFYFQSRVLSKFVSICKLAQLLVSSLIKLYLLLVRADLFWFVLVSLIDQIILAVALYLAYQFQQTGSFFHRFDWMVARKMLLNSWPLILSGVTVTLYMKIDVIMLQEMAGNKEVGIYSAATRLSEIWYFIPIIIVASVSPAIINVHSIDSVLYRRRLRQLYFLMVWLAISIALPVSLMSDKIVGVLFGNEFAAAGPVLSIHMWACIAVFLGVASSQYLLIEQLQKISFYRTIIGLGCNIALNFLMIPAMGAKGAAIATVVSYFVATYSLIFFKSTRSHTAFLFGALYRRSR